PSAHGRHRRRAIRLEDVRDDPDGVGELFLAGNQRRKRALGERAMANLTPTRPAQEGHLADRERREVVVEHEALPGLALEALDFLGILGGAEGARDERLGLAA